MKRNPDLPALHDATIPVSYDSLLAKRGEKGGVLIDPETFTPKEIRIAIGLSPEIERRVLAHELLEWREAKRAKNSGMSFGEYFEMRSSGDKGPAHRWFPVD
jgi:hypothetical protein